MHGLLVWDDERSYAQVFQGFVRDAASGKTKLKLDPTEPLYIIELGAGSGKFSFFMLKALSEMREVRAPLPILCHNLTT